MNKYRTISMCLAAMLLAACGNSGPAAPAVGAPPAEVGVITLAPQPVELAVELPGRTAANRIAQVRPQVDGIVLRRLFTEGAEVRAGQPLYQIDAAPYRATVQRAEAAVASAEAQLNAARLLAQRYGQLQQGGVVSRQDFDDAEAARLTAEASVAAARAALDTARIDLGYTELRSPITGRIGRSLVTEGALVTRNQDEPLATVAQLDPILVDVTQSSAELLRLQQDIAAGHLQQDARQEAVVTLTLEDGREYPRKGRLRFTEVTVDEGTGSVVLRAEFPNPDYLLLPGMFVRAQLQTGSNPEALLVPQAGVSRNARGEAMVLVVDAQGKVGERMVEVSRAVGSRWIVTQGLAAGERVIVEGLQKARPGATVNAMPATGR